MVNQTVLVEETAVDRTVEVSIRGCSSRPVRRVELANTILSAYRSSLNEFLCDLAHRGIEAEVPVAGR